MTSTQVYRVGLPVVLIAGCGTVGMVLASGAVQAAVIAGVVLAVVLAGLFAIGARERRRGNTAVDEPLVKVSVPTRRVIFGLTLAASCANLALRIVDDSHSIWVVVWLLVIVGHIVSIVSLRRRGLL